MYPVLGMITLDLLVVPASVPCERVFSGAKHMDADHRNHLLPELQLLGAIQIAKADMLPGGMGRRRKRGWNGRNLSNGVSVNGRPQLLKRKSSAS